MLRIATLAANAAALVAAPASAASIHVSTVGKTPEQLKAEIYAAANRACRIETSGSVLEVPLQAACVTDAVRSAMAQLAAAPTRLSER